MADHDPLTEAIDSISAAATPAREAMVGRHYSQPMTDAY